MLRKSIPWSLACATLMFGLCGQLTPVEGATCAKCRAKQQQARLAKAAQLRVVQNEAGVESELQDSGAAPSVMDEGVVDEGMVDEGVVNEGVVDEGVISGGAPIEEHAVSEGGDCASGDCSANGCGQRGCRKGRLCGKCRRKLINKKTNPYAVSPPRNGLFYNYYAQDSCGGAPAALYLSPRPTPPLVGHTYITYEPLMPHEFLYRPHDKHYFRNDGGILPDNWTTVRYWSPIFPVFPALWR